MVVNDRQQVGVRKLMMMKKMMCPLLTHPQRTPRTTMLMMMTTMSSGYGRTSSFWRFMPGGELTICHVALGIWKVVSKLYLSYLGFKLYLVLLNMEDYLCYDCYA